MKENKIPSTESNANELLEQYYLSASELKILIPGLNIKKARAYITELQEEMKQKNIFIPETKPKVALTKLVKKKFGL